MKIYDHLRIEKSDRSSQSSSDTEVKRLSYYAHRDQSSKSYSMSSPESVPAEHRQSSLYNRIVRSFKSPWAELLVLYSILAQVLALNNEDGENALFIESLKTRILDEELSLVSFLHGYLRPPQMLLDTMAAMLLVLGYAKIEVKVNVIVLHYSDVLECCVVV